jgi:RimJ/RimL family protein N-acetyltransferase
MASYAKFKHGLYLVSLKDTTPIGICGLIKRDTLDDKDIGFAFLPKYTGNGYALEAASVILQNARKKFGLKRIAAITLENNQRSIQLLTKLGFVFEKKIRFTGDEKELMLMVNEQTFPANQV